MNKVSIALLCVVCMVGCKKPTAKKNTPDKRNPNIDDIINIIKKHHKHASEVESIDIAFSKSYSKIYMDPSIHYDFKMILTRIKQYSKYIRSPAIAKTACGEKLENAYLFYVAGTLAFHTKWNKWFLSNWPVILKIMKSKKISFSKAVNICTEKKQCPNEPNHRVSFS